MTDLATLVVKLEAQTAQYQAQLEKATARLQKFDKEAGSIALRIGKGLAAAAVATAVGFGYMAEKALENADHINKLSQQTGVSTEKLSQLQFATKLSDVEFDTFAKNIGKLQQAMANAQRNTGNTREEFDKLHVSFENSDGSLRDTSDVLLDLADKFSKMKDGAAKATLAQDFFGKSGARLIPFLNQGKAGIKALLEEADRLGLTISGPTAAAAEEFNDNLTRIKSASQGLANQFIKEALPTLLAISQNFIESAKNGGALEVAFKGIAVGFKVLVSAGIVLISVFQQVGRVIYGVVSAQLDLLQGHLSDAAIDLRATFEDVAKNVAGDVDTLGKIWSGASAKFEAGAKGVNKALNDGIKFDDEKAKKAAESALKQLTDIVVKLRTEVETFNLGETAVAKYRVAHGDLAEKIKAAGKAGVEAGKQFVELSTKFELLKNQQAVTEIDNQIKELTGHTAEAAVAAFDLQNALLKASLADTGDKVGLERLQHLRDLTEAAGKYNELEQQSIKVRDDLAEAEENIANLQATGSINELEALAREDEARKQAVARLQEIIDKQKVIAQDSGNTALIQSARQSGLALTQLRNSADQLAKKLSGDVQDAGASAFSSFLQGARSAGDAFRDFLSSLEKQVADFVAKDLFRRLFSGLTSDSSGGGGGWLSFLGKAAGMLGGLFGGGTAAAAGAAGAATFASTAQTVTETSGGITTLFGSVMDSGGTGMAGRAYMIGRGAQPEWYVPHTAGAFVPAGGMGMTVHQNFYLPNMVGVTRQTQSQLAAAASRGLSSANARGN